MNRYVAEVFGTFSLVFAGTGAIVIDEVTGGGVTHVGVALTFGLIVMSMIYAVGDVSGAHLNPAVTLGFFIARRFDSKQVMPYIACQCIGALAASLLLQALFPENPGLGGTTPRGSDWQSFVLEAVLTFILMAVVLNVSIGSKEKGMFAGVAVGGVIALEALFAGPICGASMNPVRSLAPALVAGHWQSQWLYVIAPCLGAMLAVPIHQCIHRKVEQGDKPMATTENQLSRKRIVFLCVENSNRSQMAEAFAHMHGDGRFEVYSAGSKPSGVINPKAIEAMRERGYDLTRHRSKGLDDIPVVEYDVAVTMGCGDQCPLLQAKQRRDWSISDPKFMAAKEFHIICDQIEAEVVKLLAEMQ